jgi:mannose-6-phosphate isomerase-like protein (cupin superfamily)
MHTSDTFTTGPATAKVVDPDGTDRVVAPAGIPLPTVDRLVGAADGAGSSLIRYEVPAGFAPPPVLHRHTRESCVGYVLRGSLTYWFEDGEPRTAAPGAAIVLPSGAWFRWANSSATEAAQVLFWFTPGGFDQFFFDVAHGLEATGYDMSRFGPILFETRARYGDEPHPG